MNRFRRRGRRTFMAYCACLGAILFCVGCNPPNNPTAFQGYIEAEYLYMASPRGGQLKSLEVERGQRVESGAILFELDPEPEESERRQASDQLLQARAQWEDLKKGQRPSEIAAQEAKRNQALASLSLAEKEFKRVEELYQDQIVPIDDLDRVRTTRDLYQAQVAELTAEIETARLGARTDAIQAAEAAVSVAEAALRQAEWNLAQKSQSAPTAALVHDTVYRPGEWVASGNPVVVLLPPSRLKVRYFVPQAALSKMNPGARVQIGFDGAPKPFIGHINYVSTQAEFTPPVIYSQQTRAKLVFMIEAAFETNDTDALRPGQPVDVTLLNP